MNCRAARDVFMTQVDCCGCLVVQVRGDEADITCNECGAVVRTVPPAGVAVTVMGDLLIDVASPMPFVPPVAPPAEP